MHDPTFSPRVREFFDHFVGLANKTDLHPLDWERFYDFMRASHTLRSRVNDRQLYDTLIREGFDETTARYTAEFYRKGREILRRSRTPRRPGQQEARGGPGSDVIASDSP